MRIAIVAPEAIPVPPRKGGSVEICIHSIAKQLAKRHDVTVYSRTHPAYPNREVRERIRYIRVPGGPPSRYIHAVAESMKGRKFDCIQVDNRPRFIPVVKSAQPSVPVYLYLHSLTFVSPSRISRGEAAASMGRASRIIANSRSLKYELEKRFPAIRHKIYKVHPGVDTDRFRPSGIRVNAALRRRFRMKGSFAVAFAGRMTPRKGLSTLIRALRHVNNRPGRLKAKLLLAGGSGSSAYRAKINRLTARLRVPVTNLGYVPHHRIHRVYQAADCFVCPSQRHEAFGLVNAEAMAAGVPVIASDIGGIGEVIRHGRNGILVRQYRNPSSFAASIRRVMLDRGLAARLSRMGRKDAVQRLSWKRTALRLEAVYRHSKHHKER